jgi:electron transport complex protein RnfB
VNECFSWVMSDFPCIGYGNAGCPGGKARPYFPAMAGLTPHSDMANRIDAWLPQTQCTQCGYPRCRAYAEAVAIGAADINRCPPGDEVTIRALAGLLNVAPKPLDTHFGSHEPRTRAVIDESVCIGCRKCIDACPVDAILGARKLMHTVIADECTGCELCLPPCPVDCIAMMPVLTRHARSASGPPPSPACGRGNEGEGWPEYAHAEAERWRARTERRLERLARRERASREKPAGNAPAHAETAPALPDDRERIRADIRAAVERVKRKRGTGK